MLTVGSKAPDFQLPNTQGKMVSLISHVSPQSPLFLVFYKYNCPTCQYAFTHLPRIAKDLGSEYFLAVAQDTPKEASDFRLKYQFDFEVLCDTKPYPVSKTYGIDFVPTVFVIEPDRTISAIAEGFDKKAIEDFVNRVVKLKNKPSYAAFDPAENVPLLKPG